MRKTMFVCFVLALVAFTVGYVSSYEKGESAESAKESELVCTGPGMVVMQEISENPPPEDWLVNFPKERIRELVFVKELKREHPDGEPFWPAYVEYRDGTLYVFDDSTYTILQYDDNFVQKGPETDISIGSSDDHIFGMVIDESGNIILSGFQFIHFVGDQYKRLRNNHDIRESVAVNNKLYTYNYDRKAGTYEYAFNVYDYNLKYLGAEAVNPFTSELYRLMYAKYVCGGNTIYFTLNSTVRIAAFNAAHGYPKAPVAVRTFSFEEEFKPYIDKANEWESQPPRPGALPRRRQIVYQMCLLDGRLCILAGWREERCIGEFNENGEMEHVYVTRISGGAQDLAARRHKNTIYFYMPITTREGGSVHVYKYDEEKEGK